MTQVEDAFTPFDAPQRDALERTLATARAAMPGAQAVSAWSMPTLRAGSDDGPYLVSIMGFARHNSLFPHSGSLASRLGGALDAYPQTKGTIHFDRDAPFPAPLLKRILKARLEEVNESYPRKSGETREYFDNGFLKSVGRIKDGEMTGSWRWYRRDGSLMRAGSFRGGRQVGTWTTYDRTSAPIKVTEF